MKYYLIGLPGCGKTTLGKLLAQHLSQQDQKWNLIDMDHEIEQDQNMSIPDIFEQKGESYFREIERKILHQVSQTNHTIISTGGGAPCFFDNIDHMNQSGTTVFIDVSAEELMSRISKSKQAQDNRPLFAKKKDEALFQDIATKHKDRRPFYTQASIIISDDNLQLSELIHRLTQKE